MRTTLLLISALVLITCPACAQGGAAGRYPVFNARVGTQTFGPKYSFDKSKPWLVETAERIHEMGSDVIKFALHDHKDETSESLASLAEVAEKDPPCRQVLDMPFRYYQLWVYPIRAKKRQCNWHKGLSPLQAKLEYQEMYDLTRYLLHTYSGSGKTFLLGHWEGDWTLLSGYDREKDPSTTAIQGMADWLNARQMAVDRAKLDEPHTGVDVLHYTEANLVAKALEGRPCVTNSVLPLCLVDLVSYSSYDGLKKPFPEFLFSCLDHIEASANTSGQFPRNVFIGEYGYPLKNGQLTPAEQGEKTREFIKATAGWGCPFVLYWEMYDNESGDEQKGFWLINNRNEKQPSYYVHQEYLAKAHVLKNLYRFWLHRNPTEDEISEFAARFDTFRPSEQMDRILDSPEMHETEHGPFWDGILEHLWGGQTAPTHTLSPDTPRSVLVNTLLDSPAYASRVSDAVFAEMLAKDMIGLDTKDSISSQAAALARRLDSGERRSRLWRETLDSEPFRLRELKLRHIDEKNSPIIARRYLPGPP